MAGSKTTESTGVKHANVGIYSKLHKIQEKVMGLGKDKKGFGYEYVTGSKVLDHIKPLMNELKLLLKQEVISIENVRQDYQTKNGSKSEILSKVQMKFTWIDCESGEKDENLFGANGQNDWDKGVGSALTYAERYFLLKFFHINTDEDDIDNPDRKPEATAPVKQPTPAAPAKPKVSKEEAIAKAVKAIEATKTGKELSEVWKKLGEKYQAVEAISKATAAHKATLIKPKAA